ncbi:MFS transporter (plasmid) [Bradyrhizobium sp. 186]|nr:MFS transporter [Bradyrhizobium sp. 186]
MSTTGALAVNTEAEGTVYRKISWRVIPLLIVCFIVAYYDRVNISFAKLQMQQELNFSDTVYGLGASLFFVGYILFEVPSNVILHRIGARKWIARIMVSWGIASALMMFVSSPIQFYIMRFLVGVMEAGFLPGVVLYFTSWFPAQRRARANSLFMLAISLSGVTGGPLAGWIMTGLAGLGGWAGWQWLFLIEGIPAVILGFVVFVYLDDKPDRPEKSGTKPSNIISCGILLSSLRLRAGLRRRHGDDRRHQWRAATDGDQIREPLPIDRVLERHADVAAGRHVRVQPLVGLGIDEAGDQVAEFDPPPAFDGFGEPLLDGAVGIWNDAVVGREPIADRIDEPLVPLLRATREQFACAVHRHRREDEIGVAAADRRNVELRERQPSSKPSHLEVSASKLRQKRSARALKNRDASLVSRRIALKSAASSPASPSSRAKRSAHISRESGKRLSHMVPWKPPKPGRNVSILESSVMSRPPAGISTHKILVGHDVPLPELARMLLQDLLEDLHCPIRVDSGTVRAAHDRVRRALEGAAVDGAPPDREVTERADVAVDDGGPAPVAVLQCQDQRARQRAPCATISSAPSPFSMNIV